MEFDSANIFDLDHRYLWGPGVDQLLADEDTDWFFVAGTTRWPLADHLGTIRDVVNDSGTSVGHIEYDAFGNVLDATGVDILFQYTGRAFDDETGLQTISTGGMTQRLAGGSAKIRLDSAVEMRICIGMWGIRARGMWIPHHQFAGSESNLPQPTIGHAPVRSA